MAEWREITRGVVFPWNCDQNGHLNVRFYAHIFDDAGFSLWNMVGCSQSAMVKRGLGVVVAQIKIDFIHELIAGEPFIVKGAFTRVGNKSAAHLLRLYNSDSDVLCATQESTEVFFDPEARRSAPMPDDIREKLAAAVAPLDGGQP